MHQTHHNTYDLADVFDEIQENSVPLSIVDHENEKKLGAALLQSITQGESRESKRNQRTIRSTPQHRQRSPAKEGTTT